MTVVAQRARAALADLRLGLDPERCFAAKPPCGLPHNVRTDNSVADIPPPQWDAPPVVPLAALAPLLAFRPTQGFHNRDKLEDAEFATRSTLPKPLRVEPGCPR